MIKTRSIIGIFLIFLFLSDIALAARYPKLDFDGFTELKLSRKKTSGNREIYLKDPIYKKLPLDLIEGPIDIERRMKLGITGKLSRKLSISYDIEQEPDFPDKFDIKVKYDRTKLTFFNYDTEFKQGEFINTKKSVNGVNLKTEDDHLDINIAFGKERSDTKKVVFYGTGSKTYSIGQKSLVKQSEKVYINESFKERDKDYVIDYFQGKITFRHPVSQTDVIKVIYEFTNPIEDFLPILSRKNFTGFRIRYDKKKGGRLVEKISTFNEYLTPYYISTKNIITKSIKEAVIGDGGKGPYYLNNFPVIKFSEKIYDQNILLVRNTDYTIDYQDGEIEFKYEIPSQDKLNITYKIKKSKIIDTDSKVTTPSIKPTANITVTKDIKPTSDMTVTKEIKVEISTTQSIIGRSKKGPYFLKHFPVIENTETLVINGITLNRKVDYKINYSTGRVDFSLEVFQEDNISISYIYTSIKELTKKRITEMRKLKKVKTPTANKKITFPVGLEENTYKLKKIPIVLGSEEIYLNSKLLTKDKDYYLDYLSGRLIFLKKIHDEDVLLVNYKHKRAKKFSEEIIGENSLGPYELTHYPVVKKSEKIVVNDYSLEKDLDYFINYEKGTVFFTIKITPVDNVRIDYKYVLTKLSQPTPTANPLSLGFTYLRETAKPTEENLVVAVSGQTPSINGTTLILTNNPVDSSSNFTVYTGTTNSTVLNTVPSSSYTVDYYLGQVDFSASPNAINPQNVQVSYSYRQSFRTEVSFRSLDGYNDSYYDENNIDFIDVPLQYQSEEVTIRGGLYSKEVRLERNIEYALDYGSDGKNPRIKFIKYDANNQGSQLMEFPDSNHIIRIKYSYTPEQSTELGNIQHTVYGANLATNIKGLHFEAETAYSINNFSRKEEEGSTTLTGTGIDNQYYQLANKNIVEDSEDIFINDYLQTKNTDYIINYSSGRIRFKNQTPTTLDSIYVTYKYYTTAATASQEKQVGNAWRTSLGYRHKGFYLQGRYLDIDRNFSPIGTIKEDVGTNLIGATTAYNYKKKLKVKFNYDSRNIFKGYKDDNSIINRQQRRYESVLKINPNKFFDTDYTFYSNYTFQPSATVPTVSSQTVTPSIDSFEESHKVNMSIGPKSFQTKVNIKNSDLRDNTTSRLIETAQYNIKNTWSPKDNYGMYELKLVSEYSKFKNIDSSSTRTYNKDIKDYGFAFNFSPHSIVRTKTTYYRTKIDEFESTSPTYSRTENNDLHNNSFKLDLRPFTWIRGIYTRQKKEAENPLNNQLPDQEITRRYRIAKFQPYGFFSFIKGGNLTGYWKRLKQANFSYSKAFRDYKKHNRKKLFNSNVSNYSFRNFNFFPAINIDYFTFSKGNSLLNNLVESSSVSSNINYTQTVRRGLKFTINPKKSFLKPFMYSYRLKNDLETRVSTYNMLSGTSNITTSSLPKYDRQQVFSFSPKKVKKFGLFNLVIEERLYDNQDSKEIYASSNVVPTASPTLTKTMDNKYGFSRTYLITYDPYSKLKTRTKFINKTDYYNRNRISTAVGCVRRNTFQRDISLEFNPHKKLKITGLYKRLEESQYASPTIDITMDTLPNNHNSRLVKNLTFYQPCFILTPHKSISFKTLYNKANLYQEYLASQNATVSINNILTNTYTLGLTLRPEHFSRRLNFLNTLSISYEYDFKNVRQGTQAKQNGVTTRLNISYTPINIRYTKLTFSFFRRSNRGIGINSVDQKNFKKETNEISQSVIKQVNDNFTKASATLSVNIPIRSPVVERVNISGGWQMVKLADSVNASNNYGINAFYIKARLIF